MLSRILATIVACWGLSGCMIVQVGVTNPVAGLTTVAVAPFFNQSDEKAIDGRRLAALYASELQKIPGLEVIPVGVVETKMREKGLEQLSGPEDAVKLAGWLNADAVVIGSITEYQPYYPPRIGLSVAWYSPYHFELPGTMPTDPLARRRLTEAVEEAYGLGIRRNIKRHAIRTGKSLNRVANSFFLDNWPENTGAATEQILPGTNGSGNGTDAPLQTEPGVATPSQDGNAGERKEPARIRGQSPETLLREPMRAVGFIPTVRRGEPAGSHFNVRRREPGISVRRIGNPSYGSDSERVLIAPPGLLRPIAFDRKLHRRVAAGGRRRAEKRGEPWGSSPRSGGMNPQARNLILQTAGESPGETGSESGESMKSAQAKPVPAPLPLGPMRKSAVTQRTVISPLMSYTRVFDAADSDLVAIWRDYLETSGDQRTGDWVARLYWSDNFLRFSARLMIVEMFQLHGGEARRRFTFKLRKHR